MKKYTTISGDTWDKIAYEQYGDEKQALHVIEANIEYANIVIFSAGIELSIPDIEVVSVANLPPWKRDPNVS